MVIYGSRPFEVNLQAIAQYLNTFSVVQGSISITIEVKKKAKDFLVIKEDCSAGASTVSVSTLHMNAGEVFKSWHDEVGHW